MCCPPILLTIADALAHQKRLLGAPDFDPSFNQLFDVTNVTDVELTSEDIRMLAQTTVFSPDARRAILVKNDLQFGLSRMVGVFRELKGEKEFASSAISKKRLNGLLPKTAPEETMTVAITRR